MTNNNTRTELHLHTKLSDDISVIKPEEALDYAIAHSHTAIAFTNLNNVQDFPAIANYQQVTEMIDALPEADQIVDTSCKDAAQKAERALYLLNEDQRAMISAETEQHLTDVLAALKNAPEPVKGVYGDVDGNGKVEATDALEVLKNVVGKEDVKHGAYIKIA